MSLINLFYSDIYKNYAFVFIKNKLLLTLMLIFVLIFYQIDYKIFFLKKKDIKKKNKKLRLIEI